MKAVRCDHVTKYFTIGRRARGEIDESTDGGRNGNRESLGKKVGNNGKSVNGYANFVGRVLHRHSYRKTAVDSVSLEVERGEIFGILGPNGCGKSTLIRMISTLLIPDEGKVTVFGCNVLRDKNTVRRLISRVSVDAAFFKSLSPFENLRYSARLYGMNAKTAETKARDILEILGFPEKFFRKPMEECSRGMQQKVAIARAFLFTPRLILMDEPTTGLDPVSKKRVQEFIMSLRRERDVTILLTSHDMEEADKLCDRAAIMNKGKFVAVGKPDDLKARLPGAKTLEDVFFGLTGEKIGEEHEDV
jgi:ABC-2 type transport system ATP-binding protein